MVSFCIRHIIDGCIIFVMLDSQATKYFSKILKTLDRLILFIKRNITRVFVSQSFPTNSHLAYLFDYVPDLSYTRHIVNIIRQ